MKKIVKTCLIVVFLIILFFVLLVSGYFLSVYVKAQTIPLNTQALTDASLSIEVYDSADNIISESNNFNMPYVSIEDIPNHTKQAFISIEDKKFYTHKGLNLKRMLKALYTNLTSMSFKEGASTISQQLIKNTQLSNQKTLERKIKEIALTKKLEKSFNKDEILEFYLNIIYFGNNCYGLESASNYYFSKSTKELTLAESALLAGLIKSPNRYSPITHKEDATKRRNLVLREMQKDGVITEEECLKQTQTPIELEIKSNIENKQNSYTESCIDEALKILKIPAKQIALSGYKIHSYQNPEHQKLLSNSLEKTDLKDNDYAGIVIDNKSYGITAYNGKSVYKVLDAKRQVGSCIKPVLVYCPALNENIITPETEVLDEKITIGEYSPSNVNGKYNGFTTVTDAVKNSINTVAIKVLSYIGIESGKSYASKLGFTFDEKDDSYALALGGMTYGENIKTLANSYVSFANGGKYSQARFISYITDKNGRVIYKHTPNGRQVFRDDAAYLMTDILKQTAKTGTARKLSTIEQTEVASKTGTVGKKNSSLNTDAYNIAYTPDITIGVWCGNLNNAPISINGGNEPTEVARKFLAEFKPTNTTFKKPSSVTEAKIDLIEKEKNHKLVLANSNTPERYTKSALFSRFNLPNEISTNFVELPNLDATCKQENSSCILTLNTQKQIEYDIFLNGEYYKTIKESEGKTKVSMPLREKENEVKIVYKFSVKNSPEKTEIFKLFSTKKIQQKNSKEWYI